MDILKEQILRAKELMGIQVLTEEPGEMISGIPTNLLHPITQEWFSKGQTMSVFQLIRMMAGCYTNNEKKEWGTVLEPMSLGSSGDEHIVTINHKLDGEPSFCLTAKKSGVSRCFNPCNLGVDSSEFETKVDGWGDINTLIVPAVAKMLSTSTIDNVGYDDDMENLFQKGGGMLGWRSDGNEYLDAKFKLTKI